MPALQPSSKPPAAPSTPSAPERQRRRLPPNDPFYSGGTIVSVPVAPAADPAPEPDVSADLVDSPTLRRLREFFRTQAQSEAPAPLETPAQPEA